MRVITGTAKGRNLEAPMGLDTRPTSAMVKEAVFSILQFELEGAKVLDLFAGSGQMGIEALSRGAKSCAFVDHSRESQAVIRHNLEHTGLMSKARVTMSDVNSYLKTASGPYDIVFLDPPYGKELLPSAFRELASVLASGGVVVCETDRRETLPQMVGDMPLYRTYRYGKTCVTIYRQPAEEV